MSSVRTESSLLFCTVGLDIHASENRDTINADILISTQLINTPHGLQKVTLGHDVIIGCAPQHEGIISSSPSLDGTWGSADYVSRSSCKLSKGRGSSDVARKEESVR